MTKPTLYGRPRWGSALIEAQLVWYDMPFDFVDVGDVFVDAEARRAFEPINPVGHVPALATPDHGVMTESAAITLYLAETLGRDDLVPGPGAPERARFLRWLVFLVANIYPTYTYGDMPERFVSDADAQKDFLRHVDAYTKKLYSILNSEAGSPWFLGDRFSALDVYVTVMTRWRPGRAWFRDSAPALTAIMDAGLALPKLSEVWARNYPND